MNERFIWDDSYTVDHAGLDEQHKAMFGYLDDLLDAIYENKGNKVIQDMIESLENNINTIFHSEEVLLMKTGYPSLKAHIKDHNSFIKSYQTIRDDFYQKGVDLLLAKKIEKDLKDSWKDHILLSDSKYKSFIKTGN